MTLPGPGTGLELIGVNMKPIPFIASIALVAAGSVLAAEPSGYRTGQSQPARVQRADIIEQTKRAMASGELKFGPLVDYQAQFIPAPEPSPQYSPSAGTRGRIAQGQTVAREAAQPALPAPQTNPRQPAQR